MLGGGRAAPHARARPGHTTHAVLLVLCPGVALAQAPVHAHLQRRLQVCARGGDDALGAHAHGDVVKERLRELLNHGQHVLQEQVGAQQAHAAVDVKPHAARRHDGVGVRPVKGRHVANGKAVAAVHVGHGHGLLDNARQRRHVGNLLHGRQEAAHALGAAKVLQLLKQQLLELRVHVKRAGHQHVGHKALGNVKLHGGLLRHKRKLLLIRAHHASHRGRWDVCALGCGSKGGCGGDPHCHELRRRPREDGVKALAQNVLRRGAR